MTSGPDPKVSLRWVREGLVIVVSILLAFGIDAWWDDRGRSVEERTLIADLEIEFQANLQTLDSLVARHRRFPVLISSLGSASPNEIAAIPPDSAQGFQAAMASASTFDPQVGTLDGAIASGKLGLLSSPDSRRLMLAWRGELDDAREQSGTLVRTCEQILYRMSRHGGPWLGGPLMTGEDLLALSRDDELMGLVRVKLGYSVFYIEQLEMMADLNRQILASLEGP